MPWNGNYSAQQQQQSNIKKEEKGNNELLLNNLNIQQQQQQQQCIQVPGTSSSSEPYRELPDAVYRQIRQVDQQQSTLTSKGITGFSARVLDRTEYKSGGYSNDVRVVQLVEIIKKPGQSLGLYLREGNGIDQFTGVFVSRFGENSELDKCGDICRPGDQILAVNNVPVKEMAIDDVVLMLSIPVVYFSEQREQFSSKQQQRLIAERSAIEQRPVVVFQKSVESDRRDSESSGILSKPASTATSWLGKRVRQQQKQKKQQEEETINTTKNEQKQIIQSKEQLLIRHRQYPQSNILNYQQQQQTSQCSIDAITQTARIPPPRILQQQQQQTIQPLKQNSPLIPNQYISHHPAYSSATLDSRWQDKKQQRHPSASAPIQRRQKVVFSGDLSNNYEGGIPNSYSQQQMPPIIPPAPTNYLYKQQQQSSFQQNSIPSLQFYNTRQPTILPTSYKSNSLPRRSVQAVFGGEGWKAASSTLQQQQQPFPRATVKWRNDYTFNAAFPFYSNNTNLIKSTNISSTTIGNNNKYLPLSPQRQRIKQPFIFSNGSVETGKGLNDGRTIADIFSSQEYRNWASEDEDIGGNNQQHRSRWSSFGTSNVIGGNNCAIRSNSLPSKALLANHLNASFEKTKLIPQQQLMMATAEGISPGERADILDRLHVSPLMNRRVPLRMAGPGFDVDQLANTGNIGNSLTGMLSVTIVEGRNLKVPDRIHSKKLYCVLEIDEIHRARTGISTPEQYFRWSERFDIDVVCANDASFFVYAWHPQLRHRFCHKGDIRLMDILLVDGFNGNRIFSLNLEPRGQLLLKISFEEMRICFSRIIKKPNNKQFGQPLNLILQREKGEVPILLKKLITEIERRGLDNSGIYYLCGATERKDHLRAQIEENINNIDISEQPVPDINLLTCLVKDFLRELSEPLIPCNIYAMLLDAASVMLPNDSEGNQKLVMRIIDCLPTQNKTTLVFLMEHLKHLLASEINNGMTIQRLCNVFGPLLFCTSNPSHQVPTDSDKQQNTSKYLNSISVDFLSVKQANIALKLIIDYWPKINNNNNNNSNENKNLN
ncbi:hypothetical protein Mgra_00008063 [Meloidogyne graminicola]|uniref:Rho GTPase-activating protein syd-1 n=1 Tax=Meloidogyne graminicola TaxID=189291 RepID=A0A8S9ZGX9_9BILA|nr:hypothetical protein Mgra_00008063 [Meloidogyne graminicola]